MTGHYYYISTFDSERFIEKASSRYTPLLGKDPFREIRSKQHPTFNTKEQAEKYLDRIGYLITSK